MHHSMPEDTRISFPLNLTLHALSAPSISVKAAHYTTSSSVHHWLVPYLSLSANTPSLRRLPSQWTFLSQRKKDRFSQLSGRGKEVFCASHGWLCCQPKRTVTDGRSRRLRLLNSINKPEGQSWILLIPANKTAIIQSQNTGMRTDW